MENYRWIVLAAAMQAFLTVAVLLLMAARRRRAFAAGKVGGDAMLNDRSWPDDVLKASNNYRSQFEIPVLFFAAVAVALAHHAGTERVPGTVHEPEVGRPDGRYLGPLLLVAEGATERLGRIAPPDPGADPLQGAVGPHHRRAPRVDVHVGGTHLDADVEQPGGQVALGSR